MCGGLRLKTPTAARIFWISFVLPSIAEKFSVWPEWMGTVKTISAEFLCGIRRQDSQCVSFKNQYIDRLNVRQHFELGISYIPDDPSS